MTKKSIPSPLELRQLLLYEPETGKLFWAHRKRELFRSDGDYRKWNTRFSGKEAFCCKNDNGYLTGRINYSLIRAHRVVWAIHNGEWPSGFIDHINGDKEDNRINNLRIANKSENAFNSKIRSDNSSGYRGVHWSKHTKKWVAKMRVRGKDINIGSFLSKEDAALAYNAAAKRYQGQFSRQSNE